MVVLRNGSRQAMSAFCLGVTFGSRTINTLNADYCHLRSRNRFANHFGNIPGCHRCQATSTLRYDSDRDNIGKKRQGEVFLVGTGPGDPRLLTLAAVDAIKTADVVFYDRLVSREILRFINEEAEQICVGKGRGIGTGSQMSIQEQLAFHANEGKRVVRLKGGDPSIFGRMGDEVCYLREQHSIEANVVPGVTAASGVAASLGFPLTHGGVASCVQFYTGHVAADCQFDTERGTIVIYMGLKELPRIVEQMLRCGAKGDMAAVAVQSGTTGEQKAVWARLDHLVDKVVENRLQSPTLIIIGDVVGMGREWIER